MSDQISGSSVIRLHDGKLTDATWPRTAAGEPENSMWHWIEINHRYNTLIWNEEDKARRTDVAAGEIAASKRLIDQYNQKRNDAVECLDEAILAEINFPFTTTTPRLNSETAGAMIDRLSILALKIFHMREQTFRVDASAAHIANCDLKLRQLVTQRIDLASCLDALLIDAREGRAYFKIYRQFKMYNDPTLNPYLYGQPSPQHAGKIAR